MQENWYDWAVRTKDYAKVLGLSIYEVSTSTFITDDDEWLVALAFDYNSANSGYWDYHWWRRQDNGTWAHKPGSTPVRYTDNSGNIIYDPMNCDRGSYTAFFGYFVIRKGAD